MESAKSTNLEPLHATILFFELKRKAFFEENIYPPVHWVLSEEIDPKLFRDSIALSESILTIPLSSMNDKKFEYLISNVTKILKS